MVNWQGFCAEARTCSGNVSFEGFIILSFSHLVQKRFELK